MGKRLPGIWVCTSASAMVFVSTVSRGIDAFSPVSKRYYVSPKGDDRNDGMSEQSAWRSAAKVNGAKFLPGDEILFERGGDWHEQLVVGSDGTEACPIVFGDYGNAQAAKPTFWGSDIVPAAAFTARGDSIYAFPVTALPTGHAYWIFADHQFLTAAVDCEKMPVRSFFVSGSTVFVKTNGTDPRTNKTVYSASDRASGTDADSSLICSNGHNHLIFRNLIGKETAAASSQAGVPDAYVFRIQGSSDVRLENCEAYSGGKHHIGVINSTGFIGKNLLAQGCIPGLPFGNAGAFVSFSDASRHGDTSQWIDCTVDHFDPQQQSFITHGPGIGSLMIQNLKSVGCSIAIGTDAPGETVTIQGGLLTGQTCDIYGTGVVVDGLRISGEAKLDLFGNNNVVQNCVDERSANEQGSVVVRGQGNVIRFNTFDHLAGHGSCISMNRSAINTKIIGNLFVGGTQVLNDDQVAGLTTDYNAVENPAAAKGLERDGHLLIGPFDLLDAPNGNYALQPSSVLIDRIPLTGIVGLTRDHLRSPRPAGAAFDVGAFEAQPAK